MDAEEEERERRTNALASIIPGVFEEAHKRQFEVSLVQIPKPTGEKKKRELRGTWWKTGFKKILCLASFKLGRMHAGGLTSKGAAGITSSSSSSPLDPQNS